MTQAVYLIGGSGTGKSSLMQYMLDEPTWMKGEYERICDLPDHNGRKELHGHRLEHELLGSGVYLGHLREGAFPGTDALSQSVMPHALVWMQEAMKYDHIYGEGDRLGKVKFLQALALISDLTVVWVTCSDEEAAARRASRGGEERKPSRIQSLLTQASNVASECFDMGARLVTLDSTRTPTPRLYEQLCDAIGGTP